MTSKATFGDFLGAARRDLSQTGRPPAQLAGDRDVFDVSRSLYRVVRVMAHYVHDIVATDGDVPSHARRVLNPWARASVEARDALTHAAGLLWQNDGGARVGARAESELGSRLQAAAGSLATGRDLLQTHFALRADGTREHRSDWAAAITSRPVTQALLAEMASLARQIVPQGAGMALSYSRDGSRTAEARHRLGAACQWLSALNASVEAAHRYEPVLPRDYELLHAVPVNAVSPRRLPDGSEPVSALCEGVIGSAERVRQAAWGSAERAPWSPGMTVTSLRKIAATSTVTSHNCHVVLKTLATCATQPGFGRISADVAVAAEAAERARDSWLRVAQTLEHVTTDTRGHLNRAAVEASDLAPWTGRLAYADPQWTLASGPTQSARSPEGLAAKPEEVPHVVGAVHQACETMTRLAHAEREQVRAAARAGRVLVPTRSLPDDADIPHPFVQAPESRVELLLADYSGALRASRQATTAVGKVAEVTQAPGRVLTAADDSHAANRDDSPASTADKFTKRAARRGSRHRPGPVQRALLDLGVERPELLRRGADIDRASERLIAEAAAELQSSRSSHGATAPDRSAGTSVLVHRALASRDVRVAASVHAAAHREPGPET